MANQDKINQLLAKQKQLEAEKSELSQHFNQLGSTLNQWMEKQTQLTQELIESFSSSGEEKTASSSTTTTDVSESKSLYNPKSVSLYQPKAQTPITKPTKTRPAKTPIQREEGWEVALGIKWFSRLGIIALLIGFALALNYSFAFFGKELKLLTAVVVAIGFYFLGNRLKPSMNILGLMLEIGGISIGYLALFAMCFIPELTLIPQKTGIGWLLLLAYSSGVLFLANKRNSELLAIIAYGYALFSTCYAQTALVGYLADLIIIISSLLLVSLQRNWQILPILMSISAWVMGIFWYGFSKDHQEFISTYNAAQTYSWGVLISYLAYAILPQYRSNPAAIALSILGSYILLNLYWRPDYFNGFSQATLEWLMTGILFIAWILSSKLSPQDNDKYNQNTLLACWTTFLVFAGAIQFDGKTTTLFLMGQAVIYGVIAQFKKNAGSFSKIWFLTLSVILSSVSSITIIGFVGHGSSAYLTTLVCLIGILCLDYFSWNKSMGIGGSIIALSMALLLYDIYWVICIPSQFQTIAYSGFGFILLAVGFITRTKRLRVCGITQLAVAVAHLIAIDLADLATLYKILAFMLLGVGLLGASYGYGMMLKQIKSKATEPIKTNEPE